MPIDPTLPLLYAQQMGAGGRLVNEVATHPEAAQATARQMAEAVLRQESQQVQKMNDPELSGAIRDGEGEKGGAGGGRERSRREAGVEEEEPRTSPSSESALLGNLINRKG